MVPAWSEGKNTVTRSRQNLTCYLLQNINQIIKQDVFGTSVTVLFHLLCNTVCRHLVGQHTGQRVRDSSGAARRPRLPLELFLPGGGVRTAGPLSLGRGLQGEEPRPPLFQHRRHRKRSADIGNTPFNLCGAMKWLDFDWCLCFFF